MSTDPTRPRTPALDALVAAAQELQLSPEERDALELSARLFNACAKFQHGEELDETSRDVHAIQDRVAARLAARVHPEFFTSREASR